MHRLWFIIIHQSKRSKRWRTQHLKNHAFWHKMSHKKVLWGPGPDKFGSCDWDLGSASTLSSVKPWPHQKRVRLHVFIWHSAKQSAGPWCGNANASGVVSPIETYRCQTIMLPHHERERASCGQSLSMLDWGLCCPQVLQENNARTRWFSWHPW